MRWPALGLASALLIASLCPPTVAAADETYTVQPGETLSGIAERLGLSPSRLAALNNLADPNRVRAGQVLRLGARSIATTAGASSLTYLVRPGDTLGVIAIAAGVPRDQLVTLNALSNPDVVRVGQTLRLPGTARASSARQPGTSGPATHWVRSPNYSAGRPYGPPIALVVHTMDGNLAGADDWFAKPGSRSSAHFGIGLRGQIHQYVDLADRAWANGRLESSHTWPGPPGINPNDLSVSVELEDWGDPRQPVSDAQYQAMLAVGRTILARYPQIRYLVTHRAISPATRPNDPGRGWLASGRLAALAAALGLELIP